MNTYSHRYRQKYSFGLVILLLLLLASCSGGGGDGGSCEVTQLNRLVHNDMLDRYYWYQQVPEQVDYDRFASAQQLLDYLRYARFDRFSYITSQSEYENLFNNGTYIGYGFSYHIESANSVRIRFTYHQSAAGLAGILRGDEILELNGQTVANIIAANSWDNIFGAPLIGVPLTIKLRRNSGLVETLILDKSKVTINTVLHSEVIDSGPNKIGYLVFNSFLQTSIVELDAVFRQFKLLGVNQLILDLRYNGGGSVEVARRLASYIRSATVANSDLFVELRLNDKYTSENLSYYLQAEPNTLVLDELTVITTEATCSASELIVSALKPYLNRVTTIGGTSCGKPVGMIPVNFCEQTLLAVNFAGFNADGDGDYFSGISAQCPVSDDPSKAFGDSSEPMLQAAKHYVDNQLCQSTVLRRSYPVTGLSGLQAIAGAI
ncbi:S41 family peptidase [Gammaproteobacteria bacterium]|nr:S41 family peptidase [Gammaproteobacteria bacterium]